MVHDGIDFDFCWRGGGLGDRGTEQDGRVRETRRRRRPILRTEHRSLLSSLTKLLVSLSLSLPTPSVDRITTCAICRAVLVVPRASHAQENPGTMPPFSHAVGV